MRTDPGSDPRPDSHPHPDSDPGSGAEGVAPRLPMPVDAARERSVRDQNRWAGIGLIALIVALAFAAGLAIGRASAPVVTSGLVPVGSPTPGASSSAPTATPGLPSDGPRLGRADATVVIDYWADYQCPFCARFAETVVPALASRIADGTVALVHRDYAFLGDESVDAAIAVRCAGREGMYWQMHDAVYAAQQGENQGAFARARLAEVAATVGLDSAAFDTCMDDRSVLVEVLDDTSAGVRAGIMSTPTVDVNGTRFPGVDDRREAAGDDRRGRGRRVACTDAHPGAVARPLERRRDGRASGG